MASWLMVDEGSILGEVVGDSGMSLGGGMKQEGGWK